MATLTVQVVLVTASLWLKQQKLLDVLEKSGAIQTSVIQNNPSQIKISNCMSLKR